MPSPRYNVNSISLSHDAVTVLQRQFYYFVTGCRHRAIKSILLFRCRITSKSILVFRHRMLPPSYNVKPIVSSQNTSILLFCHRKRAQWYNANYIVSSQDTVTALQCQFYCFVINVVTVIQRRLLCFCNRWKLWLDRESNPFADRANTLYHWATDLPGHLINNFSP